MQSLRAAATSSSCRTLSSSTARHSSLRSPVVSLAPITSSSLPSRPFSQAHAVQSGGGHESQYEPPSGWLFGVKPGEQYEKEGWENLFLWGMVGTTALGVVAYAFKPDTSIQTWALEEARRRLEAEGILPDPDVKKE